MILPFFLFTYHDLTYENQDGHEEQDKLLNSPEVSIFHSFFFRVVESKGSLMGLVPRNPLSPSPVPCSHKDPKDPILPQHQS